MITSEVVEQVREKIAAAALRSGRQPGEVTLLVAGKYADAAHLQEVVDAGHVVIGENRVQDTIYKQPLVRGATWHMIGHLQTNKVRKAAELFDMIQTVDSIDLAHKLNVALGPLAKVMPILIEVNIAEEESKHGALSQDLGLLVDAVMRLPQLKLEGLMTMPPFAEHAEENRRYFAALRALRDKMETDFGIKLPQLSMGTSQDFEVAIEEGATMVRLGRSLFHPHVN